MITVSSKPPIIYVVGGIVMIVVVKILDLTLKENVASLIIQILIGTLIWFCILYISKDAILGRIKNEIKKRLRRI